MIRIIIDSTTNLKEELKDNFTVVPLSLRFGDEEYVDGVTISHDEFYKKLTNSNVVPTTSQPTPEAFSKIFKEVSDAGDQALVITIASKLSGTYQSAAIAATEHKDIYVVDSKSVAIGTAILVEMAFDMVNRGMSLCDIVAKLEEEREKLTIIAMVDTLEYLKRGGRISKTVAFAGGLLSIKPILCVANGEITMISKARGEKQALALITKEIENAGGADLTKPFLLGYTGLDNSLLQKYIKDNAQVWGKEPKDIPYTILGSVIGTHAGPGAVVTAFFKN